MYSYFDGAAADPKLPTWDGTGGAIGLETYTKLAKGFAAGTEDAKVNLCAPRLWQNLRGEARRHVFDLDQDKLRAAGVVKILLEALEAAYPEGPLKKLPRRYRTLFKDVRYEGGPLTPILSQFERAKAELEATDKD